MTIKIYTKTNCSYCVRAKNWFNTHNIQYTEVSLDDPNVLEQFKLENPTLRSVPQIFVTDKGLTTRIGGYDDLIVSSFAKRITESAKAVL